jgi:ABC transporter, ATP-binding protein
MEMKNKKSIVNNIKVVKILNKCTPSQIPLIIANAVLKSIQAIINILLFKYVFNMLIIKIEYNVLITNLIIIFTANMIILMINIFIEQFFIAKNKRIIVGHFQKLLFDKSVKFELECFEKMEYYDEFKKSKDQVEKRIEDIQETLSSFVSSIFGIGAFIGLIITMEPIIIIFSFASVLMSLFLNKKAISMQYDFYEKITPLERKVDYFLKISTNREYAKDVRMYSGFVTLIKTKFNCNLSNIIETIKSFSKKYSYVLVFQNLVVQGVNLITVIYIVRKVFFKLISIGDFVALAGSNQQLIEHISTLFRVIPEIYEHGLYLENLFNFLEYNVKVYDGEIDSVDEKNLEIKLENVSYMYPETNVYAVENLTMKIKQGEKVAIVGENGAGKSTLIKLLCRLYDPTSGRLYFQNELYKDLKMDIIRDNISVLFQDFKMYSLPVIDNVLMKEVTEKDGDIENVKEMLRVLRMLQRVEKCDNGIFTEISREFSNKGTLFSGGEEQRIAIARIFLQDKKIYIFDEPLSKIDPLSENKIFDLLIEKCSDKTLILISHHLSNLYKMDTIYFLENGKVKEKGSHEELMAKKGLYYNMYMQQTERYLLQKN